MDAERDRSVASSVALCRLADRPEKHAAGPRVGLKLNRVAACLLPILILESVTDSNSTYIPGALAIKQRQA